MGCSGRVKEADIRPEQKWDFISLNDFKSSSYFTPFAYGYLWVSLAISIAVYSVDTLTAVNLLAFNRWSGEIKPFIPLEISKWLFSACIIASWVNLGFEYIRAIRVMKRGAVAESYLDSLAVRLQCVRMGKQGRGWRRFLVFAELTKSKKGVEYVALFTYFSFQSWIRIIFCQGPRQVVNALTLYSVFRAKLDPTEAADVGSGILTVFKNIGILANDQRQQAVILSGMLFTLVIWIFGALSLIIAMILYLLFLWHYIPNADGGLSGYCERKINGRLSKIVSVKVNKALEEEERKRLKADAKAVKKGEKAVFGRQATLPTLFDPKTDDKLPNMPMLNRNDTMTTLPVYSSRPGTPSGQPTLPAFELDAFDQKRPFPPRTAPGGSSKSNTNFASNVPLIGNASDMGYGRSASPAPSLPPLDTNGFAAAPKRPITANSTTSNKSQWSRGQPGPRMPSAMGDRGYTQSPVSYNEQSPQSSTDPYGRAVPRAVEDLRSNTPIGAPSMGRRTPFDQNLLNGRQSPAPGPGSEYGRNSPALSYRGPTPPADPYQPFFPQGAPSSRSASTAPTPNQNRGPQYRNMTDPGPRGSHPSNDYFANAPRPMPQVPGTAQSGRGTPNGERAPAQNGVFGRGGPAFGPGNPAVGQGQGGYGR